MTPALLAVIVDHMEAEAPKEACGLLVWDGVVNATYVPCRNIAETPEDHFVIAPEDWARAEDTGTILGIVHSHPTGPAVPSEGDRVGCDHSMVPWWVVGPGGAWTRIAPKGWDILGRPFAWGIQDCYTLAMDVYGGLPDFLRSPLFWEAKSLFADGLQSAGFREVDEDPTPGDGLLMSLKGRGIANHCAVYVGSGRIFHHLPGRLSVEENLGPLHRAVISVVRRAA